MSNPNIPESPTKAESGESFGSILLQFERSHTAKTAEGLCEGTIVSVSSDSVCIDLGFKTEGAATQRRVQVRPSSFDYYGGVLGAAAIALERFGSPSQ